MVYGDRKSWIATTVILLLTPIWQLQRNTSHRVRGLNTIQGNLSVSGANGRPRATLVSTGQTVSLLQLFSYVLNSKLHDSAAESHIH